MLVPSDHVDPDEAGADGMLQVGVAQVVRVAVSPENLTNNQSKKYLKLIKYVRY